MKFKVTFLLAVLALVISSLACRFGAEMSLENLQLAFDSDGKKPTTVFSPNDVFYAVADLKNAPAGTVVTAQWIGVDIEEIDPGEIIYEQSINDFTDDSFSGTIYFKLSNDSGWPEGEYKVEVFLNDTLIQSATFYVQ